MEHPFSFADSEYKNKRRQTRKEKFLERMETLVPWKRMVSVISIKLNIYGMVMRISSSPMPVIVAQKNGTS